MRFECYVYVLFWLEGGKDKEEDMQQQQGGGPVVMSIFVFTLAGPFGE